MSSPRPPLGLLLKQVQQALRSDVEQALAGSGLTLPQVAVLSALRLRPGQSSAELARIQRDEFAELQTALKQAQAFKSLGDKPLIVVTAAKDAQDRWLPLQDEMATLSTNSLHRVLPNTTHASLIEDKGDAAMASQAIHDVVESVRAATPLAKP